ncbi:MAG: hypothetical protein JRH11_17660 [Deltaproteobacteria bacterium]|nr:hypothetical protein [Deltaproteobacteria bacterium]
MRIVILTLVSSSLFTLVITLAGCGATMSREEGLPQLRAAIERDISSPEESQENSRLVEAILDNTLLHGMFRAEVEEAIGRGDQCSRHPRCQEHGYDGNDWFYTVGQMGDGRTGALPILIVGFDTSGRVTKTWNLRTH